MKKALIHQTPAERLANNSASTISAIQQNTIEVIKALKANTPDNSELIEKLQENKQKLDEVKSASLITNQNTKKSNELLIKLTEKEDTTVVSIDTGEAEVITIKGEKGDKGEKGIDGKDGRDGVDGKDGIAGKDAVAPTVAEILRNVRVPKDGRDGLDALPAKDGKDGSPDEPDMVVEKVNKATKKIDGKQVKGFPEMQRVVENYGSNPSGASFSGGKTVRYLDDGVETSAHVTELNFGSNLTLTYAGDGRLTVSATGGGAGGHTIEDEGTPLTTRTKLNFVGTGVAVTDDSGDDASVVTINKVNDSSYYFVAASNATAKELLLADYTCDGTADEVQINLALDAIRAVGGEVRLSSGDFAIAASINLLGNVAESDGNPFMKLLGAGSEATVLTGGSNINVIATGQRAKYEIAYFTIIAAGSGDCISQTAGTERGNWQSWIHDVYLQGNFVNHTGWGLDMQSPFRMRFENIEMNGVANGANFVAHTDAFNPGNLTVDRMFIDLWNDASNASAIGFQLKVNGTTSTNVMNLVSVNRLDIAGGSALTSSIGISIVGASASYGDSRHHTFTNLNIEDIKTVIKHVRGRDCSYNDINYCRPLSGGTIIDLDSTSHNNSFENLYAVAQGASQTFNLIVDSNGSSNLPNRLTRVDGFQPSTVTINATLATNTILEQIDLSGGSPTIDTDITNRNNVRTFADVLVTDEVYGVGWNGSLEVPTKNALYDKIETLGGSGITRSVSSIAGNTTAGSTASTDYVYFTTATLTLTLPTAVGNTNRYTVKCVAGVLTIDGAGAETIDGTATISVQIEDSVDLISNGTEFKVV